MAYVTADVKVWERRVKARLAGKLPPPRSDMVENCALCHKSEWKTALYTVGCSEWYRWASRGARKADPHLELCHSCLTHRVCYECFNISRRNNHATWPCMSRRDRRPKPIRCSFCPPVEGQGEEPRPKPKGRGQFIWNRSADGYTHICQLCQEDTEKALQEEALAKVPMPPMIDLTKPPVQQANQE
jgi:hypothetical protein